MNTPLFLRDPLWAGLIWKLGLTVFCGAVYLGIKNERRRHDWWISVLSVFKLANAEEDNEDTMIMSRLIFRWASVIMVVVLGYHSWLLINRAFHPFAETIDANALPSEQPGVGGQGQVGGAPAPQATGDPTQRDPGRLPERPDPAVGGAPSGGGGTVNMGGPAGGGGATGGGGWVGGQNEPIPTPGGDQGTH